MSCGITEYADMQSCQGNGLPNVMDSVLEPDSLLHEDCGHVKGGHCVTPPLAVDHPGAGTNPSPNGTWHILDRKMQHQWREDMLDEEKCMLLQTKMDAFLGKHELGFALLLIPREPLAPPSGPDPFWGITTNGRDTGHLGALPTDSQQGIMRANLPASHTELVLGDDEVVDMGLTCHNAPTHGESGHDTMGAVGAASHDDLSTWVEGSGASIQPWGLGSVTGAALGVLLISILAWTAPPTRCPQFAFQWFSLAAQMNFEILHRYGMDLDVAFAAQPFLSLTVGSEFCPAAVLAPLCFRHPLWPRVHHWLTTSIRYPLEPLHESDQIADLTAMLEHGNHQLATFHHAQLVQMLTDEVERGWQLILPCATTLLVPGAVIALLGMVLQDSIDEHGEIVPKWCLTHDQSYNVTPNTQRSVNDRLLVQELTPCRFGRALLHHIHCIMGFHSCHPAAKILQMKADLKLAYWWLHYSMCTAQQYMVAINDFILVALHLTFGGAANPSQWSDISELTCDLTNKIMRDEGWDHQVLQSPHQAMIGDTPELEVPDVSLAPASALAVTLPPDDMPKSDCYIDNLFAAFLEYDFHWGSHIIPFVLHLVGWPIAADESLKCDDILSLSKFLAEAMPAEWKMILGWIMDTHHLQIELPANKHTAWTTAIHSLLTADRATFKELKKLLGHLNHDGFVIPLAHHFLGWLCPDGNVCCSKMVLG